MVGDGAFSHKIDCVRKFYEILNLKGHQNCITGSKVSEQVFNFFKGNFSFNLTYPYKRKKKKKPLNVLTKIIGTINVHRLIDLPENFFQGVLIFSYKAIILLQKPFLKIYDFLLPKK